MAKRRKHHKRGRRMSGMGALRNFNLMETAGVMAGAVAGKFLNKVIPATLDKKIVAGGKIVLGALLPSLVRSGKGKDVAQGLGNGIIAVGGLELLSAMGVLQGMGVPADSDTLAVAIEGIEDVSFEDVSERVGADVLGADVLGADDIPVVNGGDIPVVNGEEQW